MNLKEKTVQLIEQEGPLLITAVLFTLVATHNGNYIGLAGLAVLGRYYIRQQRRRTTTTEDEKETQ